MTELRCDLVVDRSRDARSDELLLLDREESVAVDAYDCAFRLDAAEGLLHSAAASADIVAVHRAAEVVV